MKGEFAPHLKKGDFVIIIGVLVLVFVLLCFLYNKENGAYVCIHVDETKMIYPLDEDRKIPISIQEKTTNMIVIKDKMAFMETADCPDQICVKHRPIQKDNEMITCLPNKVFVEIISKDGIDVDN